MKKYFAFGLVVSSFMTLTAFGNDGPGSNSQPNAPVSSASKLILRDQSCDEVASFFNSIESQTNGFSFSAQCKNRHNSTLGNHVAAIILDPIIAAGAIVGYLGDSVAGTTEVGDPQFISTNPTEFWAELNVSLQLNDDASSHSYLLPTTYNSQEACEASGKLISSPKFKNITVTSTCTPTTQSEWKHDIRNLDQGKTYLTQDACNQNSPKPTGIGNQNSILAACLPLQLHIGDSVFLQIGAGESAGGTIKGFDEQGGWVLTDVLPGRGIPEEWRPYSSDFRRVVQPSEKVTLVLDSQGNGTRQISLDACYQTIGALNASNPSLDAGCMDGFSIPNATRDAHEFDSNPNINSSVTSITNVAGFDLSMNGKEFSPSECQALADKWNSVPHESTITAETYACSNVVSKTWTLEIQIAKDNE